MIIGITGKIGTGKSTLAKKLALKKGGIILEMDEVGHSILKKQKIKSQLIKKFGEQILNKNSEINRSLLKKIVFSSKKSLDELEKIVHPDMKIEMKNHIDKAKKEKKSLFIVGALWEKFDFPSFCETIITAKCSKQKAYQRIKDRKNAPTKKEFDFIWNRQKNYQA